LGVVERVGHGNVESALGREAINGRPRHFHVRQAVTLQNFNVFDL